MTTNTHKNLYLFFISLIFIIFCVFCSVQTHKKVEKSPVEIKVQEQEMYKTWDRQRFTFMTETGKKIFSFPLKKYDFVGNFFENILFVANILSEEEKTVGAHVYVLKLTMIDTKGEIIKELPYEVKLSSLDNLPFFYKGIAKIYLEAGETNFVYIDNKGNEIQPNQVSKEADDILSLTKFSYTIDRIEEGYGDANTLVYVTHTPDDNSLEKYSAKCKNDYTEFYNCVGYKDKEGNVVVKPHLSPRLDNFYNGLTIATFQEDDLYNKYVNTKGEYLNNVKYEWAEPFCKKLAFVQKENKYGYINTKGKWIWSTNCNPNQNCIFMYTGFFGSTQTYLNPPDYEDYKE